MSWVTVVWAMIASACLSLAVIHGLVWCWRRAAKANLLLAAAAAVIAVLALCELSVMQTSTVEAMTVRIRWGHVPISLALVLLAWFVRAYFRAGRVWLLWSFIAARTLGLVLNFTTGVNANFLAITTVRPVPFLRETVFVAGGVPNPAMLVNQVGSILLILYVAGASLAVWRRGEHRKALVGGSIVFFVVAGQLQTVLVFWGGVSMPIMISPFYLGVVVVMGLELSRDVLRAAELSEELRESEERMNLAARAAELGLWVWDIERDGIWSTDKGRELFGFAESEPLNFALFTERLHPDDRGSVRAAVEAAIASDGDYYNEHRVRTGTAPERWIAARGRIEFGHERRPLRMRGVSIDITSRKEAEAELKERRGELAHLSRVSMLGELSGSLAHELNQPLTAILSNAQAAQRYLDRPEPDLVELRAILADIVAEDERAGEVIRRLRLLFKKGEVEQKALDANELVIEVLKVMRSDLAEHGVSVVTELAPDLAPIRGDGVQLQQVLLNLVMNACDAVADNQPGQRRLTVRTLPADGAGLRIEVTDIGRGLPEVNPERVFERYYTTKPNGLGLGLSVCRTILAAHGGTLHAARNPGGGTTFICNLGGARA